MNRLFTVFALSVVLIFALSCSGEVHLATTGELDDQYQRKFLPDPFLSGCTTTLPTSLVPQFGIERTNYYIGVPVGTESCTVTPTARSTTSSISVNGNEVISGTASQAIQTATTGPITIRVTDQDGLSTFTYILNAIKLSGSENTDSSLSALTIAPVDISSFSPSTTSYSCSVDFDTVSATITPTAGNAKARIYINNNVTSSGAPKTLPLALGLNLITIRVIAEDFSETSYTVTINRTIPAILGLLISEWANIGTNIDYIELWNSGTQSLNITRDFEIMIGTTSISLKQYGTDHNVATYAYIPSSGGVSIAPNEVILVVDSDVLPENIDTIIAMGVPAGTKIFTSDQTTLIGGNKRLSDSQAFIKLGSYEWSHTPDPASFTVAGMTSTVMRLKPTFNPTTDSYTNTSSWLNGSKSTGSPGTRN